MALSFILIDVARIAIPASRSETMTAPGLALTAVG